MKTLLLYRPNTDYERTVLDYVRDFKMQTGKDLPTMDVDSPEGSEICKIYDIVQFPAILVTDNDGKYLNLWVGETLPQIGEVSYYVEPER